jgi:hypothetical protein
MRRTTDGGPGSHFPGARKLYCNYTAICYLVGFPRPPNKAI